MLVMYSADLQKSARASGLYKKIVDDLTKCVFCDLRDKYIIDKTSHVVLAVNLFPYINGQLIIIPLRHVEKLNELTTQEWADIKILTEKALKLLKDTYGINDVWVIYREGDRAGKSVRHLHVNITPYKQGLVQWNYQEITQEPLKVAEKLRQL